MAEDLRFEVVGRLKELTRGINIADLARQNGITISETGKINKGWVGQTLDKLAKTTGGNLSRPDGPDFELKSVHVVQKDGAWVPKETIAITMFNPSAVLQGTFEESPLWHKLQRLILVGHSYPDTLRQSAFVRFIVPVDVSDPTLKERIELVWNRIRGLVLDGKIAGYSSKGTSNDFVQLRTKGSGKTQGTCPLTGEKFNSRAFYATKEFIKYVRGDLN